MEGNLEGQYSQRFCSTVNLNVHDHFISTARLFHNILIAGSYPTLFREQNEITLALCSCSGYFNNTSINFSLPLSDLCASQSTVNAPPFASYRHFKRRSCVF